MPRAQQVQEVLGNSDLVSMTERVDEVAVRMGQLVNRGCVEGLDRHSPRHWKPRGLRWGWTAVIWLASSLTEGDHRKVSVEASLTGMKPTLSHLSAQVVDPLDGSDARLGHLRQHVSQPPYWHGIEEDVKAHSLAVYPLPHDVIRGDATTVSGAHDGRAGGRWPLGPRQDDPRRPQINVMTGS